MAIQSVNPHNGSVIAEYEEFSPEKIEEIIRQAHEAYQKWQKEPASSRASYLNKVADLLSERRDAAAEVISQEMGKLFAESKAEVDMTIRILRYYASNVEKFVELEEIESSVGKAFIKYEPIGVILGVEPWNFPFYQMVRMAAPNLAAGNTVIMKQASNVTGCALFFQKLFDDADVPKGVYNTIILGGAKTSDLMNDERIVGASLTGSEKAGAALAQIASKNLKKTVLELGGSDAMIVLDDINIDEAVDTAFRGRMRNMGQICVSSKRIILHEKIADTFIKKFNERLDQLKAGDPLEEGVTLAPVSTEDALETLLDQVKRAVEGGAKLERGGTRIDRPGFYLEPAVLTGLTPDNPLYYEEMFGPIVVFHRVKSDEEALKIANDSPFGLGGSVLSTDIPRAMKVAEGIETGMVFINDITDTTPELPFGGTKRSGIGRELSKDGFLEFVNKKLISVHGEK